MSKVIIAPRAKDDLRQIKQYLVENRSKDVARRVIEAIKKGIAHIEAYPEACSPREDLSGDGYSVWSHPVGSYVIYYLNEDPPKVTRVKHGSSDPDFLYP